MICYVFLIDFIKNSYIVFVKLIWNNKTNRVMRFKAILLTDISIIFFKKCYKAITIIVFNQQNWREDDLTSIWG